MIDLSEYQQNYLFAISPPGQAMLASTTAGSTGPFVNMSETEIVGRLSDAFWMMRLVGMDFLACWNCSDDGIITPRTSGNIGNTQQRLPPSWYLDGSIDSSTGLPDLGRQIVQAIILYAAYKSVQTQLINIKTMVSYKAGPVSYEVQQSANVLQNLLKILTAEIDITITRLSDLGSTTVQVFDAVMEVTRNQELGSATWVRGGGTSNGGRDYV